MLNTVEVRVLMSDCNLQFHMHVVSSNQKPFYRWTLIPPWISNYTYYKEWNEITYPFQNFNGTATEACKLGSNVILYFYPASDYIAML